MDNCMLMYSKSSRGQAKQRADIEAREMDR